MILFDFNGTMVFDAHYHDLAWEQIAKEIRGYPVTPEELNKHGHGKVNREIICYLNPKLSDEDSAVISYRKEALYRQIAASDSGYHLVDGLEKFLYFLKDNGYAINIASASIKPNIDFFVEFFKLDRFVNPELIKYDDGSYADKKAMFIDAAKAYNSDIKTSLVFEDSTSGVACAQAIGVKHLIVICEKEREAAFKDFNNIDYFIRDFNDQRIYESIKEVAYD